MSGAFGGFGQPLGGATDRDDGALVEITDLDAVHERHPIPLPVESVGQDDLAWGPRGYAGLEIDLALDLVADLQIQLIRVGFCQRMRLPVGHRHSLPDDRVDR